MNRVLASPLNRKPWTGCCISSRTYFSVCFRSSFLNTKLCEIWKVSQSNADINEKKDLGTNRSKWRENVDQFTNKSHRTRPNCADALLSTQICPTAWLVAAHPRGIYPTNWLAAASLPKNDGFLRVYTKPCELQRRNGGSAWNTKLPCGKQLSFPGAYGRVTPPSTALWPSKKRTSRTISLTLSSRLIQIQWQNRVKATGRRAGMQEVPEGWS